MATSPHDPERALLRVAVPAPHARQGRDVGEDLARPHGESRRAARGRAASRSRATSPARSSTARSTRSPSRRSRQGVIWTGSNDGPFHVTRDNGKTWTNVTPKDLPTGGRVQWIDAVAAPARLGLLRRLPVPARRLRAVHLPDRRLRQDVDAADRRQERHPRRLRRRASCARIRTARACSTPAPSSACSSRSTTARTGRRSSLNLPNVPITDIKVHQKDLRRRDAGPGVLDPRQPDVAAPDRRRRRRRRDAPVHAARRLPHARRARRRSGRSSSTTCRRRRPGPVTMEILDAKGAVVNSYNSETPAPAARASRRARRRGRRGRRSAPAMPGSRRGADGRRGGGGRRRA